MYRLLIAFLFSGVVFAQTLAPTFNQNGLSLHNSFIWQDQVEFPNFSGPGGNFAGDCLWKVVPGETLITASGTLHLSGIETALEDLDSTTAFDHPDLHIYEATYDAKGRLVPDFSKNLVKITLGQTVLPRPTELKRSGFWVLNWSMGAPIPLPVTSPARDKPLAICLMAKPGEAMALEDGVVFPLTASENYTRTPQASYSGYYDASKGELGLADGTWKKSGMAKPYPAGEAWLEIAFVEPIIQPWCSSAIDQLGVTSFQDRGVGSTWTDLASGTAVPGLIGWRLESLQDATAANNWAFFLLNLSRPTTTFTLPGSTTTMALNILDPNLTLLAMLVPSRQIEKLPGYTNDFTDGVFATGMLQLPRKSHFIGVDLYVGAAMVDLTRGTFTGATNTCTIHLR